MKLARYRFATTVRRQWRSYTGIVILVGLLGGIGLFALAGARRTQSAYPRFLRAVHASTLAIDPGGLDLEQANQVLAEVSKRPEVVQTRSYVSFDGGELHSNGQPNFDHDFEILASVDGRYFDQDRFTTTKGRLPNPRRPNEIAVNEAAAELYGYQVGQRLRIGLYTDEQVNDPAFFEHPTAPKATDDVIIAGIGLFPEEVVQDDYDRSPLVLFTPAYTKKHIALGTYVWQGLLLRHGDRDIKTIKAAYVSKLDPNSPQFFRTTSIDAFHALQSLRPLSIALAAFGCIFLVAALLLAGQALSRQLHYERDEREVWRALGARPRESLAASILPALLIVLAGAVLAVGVAVAASPAMPIGPVRRVEVSGGVDVDFAVLGLGAVVLVVVLLAVALFVAWRHAPTSRTVQASSPRRSATVESAARAGLRPSTLMGLRMAFESGEGSSAVPVRSVTASLAVAVAAVVAAITFASSLHELVSTPARFGWNWDATMWVQGGYGNVDRPATDRRLARDPNVAGWSHGWFGSALVDRQNLPLLGMEPGVAVGPPIVEGRAIRNSKEAVLGVATIDALGKHIGDSIRIGDAHSTTKVRIVGTAVFPTIGIVHGEHTSLGVGAIVDKDLVPGARNIYDVEKPGGNTVFVRFKPGVDRDAEIRRLRHDEQIFGAGYQGVDIERVHRPAEIVNTRDTGAAPGVLAGALALAAAVSLGLALVSSVRRRQRELGLLKTLGFTRRQLSLTVAWQATTFAVLALVVGVPVGVALGRWSWNLFARELDVLPRSHLPLLTIAITGIAVVAVINFVALLPARSARTVNAAALLREQ